MNSFACFSLDLTGLLIVLGIALLIAVTATSLIAVVLSFVFKLPVQTMLVAEAIVLLICAGVAGALGSGLGGMVVLALLGVAACVVILAMNWLFVRVTGRRGAKEGKELCTLELSEQSNFGVAK